MSHDVSEWMLETYARNAAHNPDAVEATAHGTEVTVAFRGKERAPWTGDKRTWESAVARAKTEWRQFSNRLDRVVVGAVDGTP